MFKTIDAFLRIRAVPQAPDYLSAQIIAAAARMEQTPKSPVRVKTKPFYQDFLDMLALPAPAYALAAVLIFGFFGGVWFDANLLEPGLTTDELSSVLAINDMFVANEWI